MPVGITCWVSIWLLCMTCTGLRAHPHQYSWRAWVRTLWRKRVSMPLPVEVNNLYTLIPCCENWNCAGHWTVPAGIRCTEDLHHGADILKDRLSWACPAMIRAVDGDPCVETLLNYFLHLCQNSVGPVQIFFLFFYFATLIYVSISKGVKMIACLIRVPEFDSWLSVSSNFLLTNALGGNCSWNPATYVGYKIEFTAPGFSLT